MTSNDLTKDVTYDTAFGQVTLNADIVRNVICKGDKRNLTTDEIVRFIKLCQAQQLNPFINGEIYLLKYGNQDANMTVGYDTYKRRAEDYPEYITTISGITVKRDDQYVQKEGTCIYPGETLIGGWAKVLKERHGKEVYIFKEVSMAEYSKASPTWKSMPATMINKVAVSQALRMAFPREFQGLYSDAELGGVEDIPKPVEKVEPAAVMAQPAPKEPEQPEPPKNTPKETPKAKEKADADVERLNAMMKWLEDNQIDTTAYCNYMTAISENVKGLQPEEYSIRAVNYWFKNQDKILHDLKGEQTDER